MKRDWITKIMDRTPEWLEFRKNGIGASEIGIICGVNPYRPTTMELYHQKVGTETRNNILNPAMFHGIYLEKYVADIWQYYDGRELGYINNYDSGEVQRKARQLHGFVVNPDYPYLFCNLDRMIEKGSYKLRPDGTPSDEILTERCPLEIKTMSSWVHKKWDKGIPEYYVTQIHQQMLITDTYYGEIACLIDGRDLVVFPIERNEAIINMIIEKGADFWARVLKGREHYQAAQDVKTFDLEEYERLMGYVQHYEPEPDDNDGYKEYLSERHKVEQEEVQGSEEMLAMAKKLQSVKQAIKILDKDKKEMENTIRYNFTKELADKIHFPGEGYMRYYNKSNSVNKVLDVRVTKPDAFVIACELEKINLDIGYE